MKFRAYHGCLESERRDGNEFRVDLEATMRCTGGDTDRLEDTVDYGKIYDAVKREMKKPCNLLENLSLRIWQAVKEELPALEEVSVSVGKKNPPVDGQCEWSTVTFRG